MSHFAYLRCMGLVLVSLHGCASASEPPNEWQNRADETVWKWSEVRSNLLFCASNELAGYEVRIIRPKAARVPEKPFTVHVFRDGKESCSFPAHQHTVFTQVGQELYVADFNPHATGCAIVAYDLQANKELWRCPLRGNPPPWHSAYTHVVNIRADPEVLVVYGSESNGRYIELVDLRNGKSVGHKKLPAEREPAK